MTLQHSSALFQRIRRILESARTGVARSVNTAQVTSNWLIGREIVEEEQKGKKRADYGKQLIEQLSAQLKADYGTGYSVQNLFYMKQFFLTYPGLIFVNGISHALRGKSRILHALRGESWKPGLLHPNLSWTHYRTLLRVEKPGARTFYEIEAIKNNWSARELERQINSLLFERLTLSKDKKGLMHLAMKGQEVQKPADVFKEPVGMEFLGLPENPVLAETRIEKALINNLQAFLLEMGRGFAFVSRQERITLDGDHFYIDMVFYHTILKCYVLVDLKVGKLTHQDLGQLQFYVNYYDKERRTKGDQPTLGLLLCTDKNDAVVKYTLSKQQRSQIFARRYKLHLPAEAEIKAEIQRKIKEFKLTRSGNRK